MCLLAVVTVLRGVGSVDDADDVVEEDVGNDDSVVVLVFVDSVAGCVRSFLAVGFTDVPIDIVPTKLRREPSIFVGLVG